jgi:hypothetical protein
VGVQIDESRCHGSAGRIDFANTLLWDVAQGRNGVTLNGDIAFVGWITRTIDNLSISDNKIVFHVCTSVLSLLRPDSCSMA